MAMCRLGELVDVPSVWSAALWVCTWVWGLCVVEGGAYAVSVAERWLSAN